MEHIGLCMSCLLALDTMKDAYGQRHAVGPCVSKGGLCAGGRGEAVCKVAGDQPRSWYMWKPHTSASRPSMRRITESAKVSFEFSEPLMRRIRLALGV